MWDLGIPRAKLEHSWGMLSKGAAFSFQYLCNIISSRISVFFDQLIPGEAVGAALQGGLLLHSWGVRQLTKAEPLWLDKMFKRDDWGKSEWEPNVLQAAGCYWTQVRRLGVLLCARLLCVPWEGSSGCRDQSSAPIQMLGKPLQALWWWTALLQALDCSTNNWIFFFSPIPIEILAAQSLAAWKISAVR